MSASMYLFRSNKFGLNIYILPAIVSAHGSYYHSFSSTKSSQLFEQFEYVLRTIRRSMNIFDEKSMAIFITIIGGD